MEFVKKSLQDLKNMTAEERLAYDKELNRIRVAKYRKTHKDEKDYKEKKKQSTYKYRKEHRDKYNELNRKHNATFREKKRLTKDEAQTIIAKAYRNKKELENNKQILNDKMAVMTISKNIVDNLKYKVKREPKVKEGTKIANDILNDIIKTTVKQAKLNKKAAYMREYRKRNKK
jgi:hypothetical protein